MKKRSARLVSTLAAASLLLPGIAAALDPPEKAALIESKSFRHPGFAFEARDLAVDALAPAAAAEVRTSLSRLGAYESSARVDSLSGRFSALMPAVPLVPGTGVGNDLVWTQGLARAARKGKRRRSTPSSATSTTTAPSSASPSRSSRASSGWPRTTTRSTSST